MRLIDADALIQYIYITSLMVKAFTPEDVIRIIDEMPTAREEDSDGVD